MAKGKLQEFIDYLEGEVKAGTIYVWGGQHTKITPAKIRSMETSTTNINRALNLYNKRVKAGYNPIYASDCSGLGVAWLCDQKHILACDHNANMLWKKCDPITRDQVKKGDWVFRVKNNNAYHIGYVVSGSGTSAMVIESKGRDDGVIKQNINAFGSSYWNKYGRPSFAFSDLGSSSISTAKATSSTSSKSSSWTVSRLLKYTEPFMRGEDVTNLQRALERLGYNVGSTGADGIFGQGTLKAVEAFQKKKGLEVDGKAGKNTITALGGTWKG